MNAPGTGLMAGRAAAGRAPAIEGVSAGEVSCLISGRLTAGDVAGVVARYREQADVAAALAPLRGEFAALIWDPRRRELMIARDQLGGRSVHYSRSGGGLAFAEEVRDLLPLLDSTPGPDPRSVGLMLVRGLLPAGRSPYEGVGRLAPGEALRWSEGTLAVERWWRPRYAGVRDGTPEELAAATVDAMDAAVARAAGGSRVGVMLSGGLDSGAVAAAAVRDPCEALVGYSGVFPAHPAMDESAKLDAIVELLGIESVRQPITGGSALAGSLDYLERWKLPVASPNHFAWRPLFARAAADRTGVLLDGEGGDEVFDVSGYVVADAVRRGRAARAVRLARVASGPGRTRAGLIRWGLKGAAPHSAHGVAARRRAPAGPRWVRQDVRARAAGDFDRFAWKRWDGPLWWRHQAFLLTDMREALDAHGYLRRRTWEVGLESRHPFMHDVDLVETVLALPPEPRLQAGLDRVLLRRGLRGRLPESVLAVQDKRHFDGLLEAAVEGGDGALLRELVGDSRAEVRAYTDPRALGEELLDVGPETAPLGASTWRAGLWRAGVVECWLRSLSDPGLAARVAERCAYAPAARLGLAERDIDI